MVLVDTSIFIDFFKKIRNKGVEKFSDILSRNIPYGINTYIYQELLQGTASERDYTLLKRYLDTQVFYELHNGRESFAEAAMIYFKCRRAGFTIRSTIDCLIVQTAVENNVALLHNDSDFDRIQGIINGLTIY
ncbi:MAG: PIN domain nuclease [bacterium]